MFQECIGIKLYIVTYRPTLWQIVQRSTICCLQGQLNFESWPLRLLTVKFCSFSDCLFLKFEHLGKIWVCATQPPPPHTGPSVGNLATNTWVVQYLDIALSKEYHKSGEESGRTVVGATFRLRIRWLAQVIMGRQSARRAATPRWPFVQRRRGRLTNWFLDWVGNISC